MNVAVYVRKSVYSDNSDSTDVQYTFAYEYAQSHFKDITLCRYEDEGYTGANTNRPGYTSLIEDIKEKKIDVVICYKIDRISRDVKDFSDFFNLLSGYNVSFVSIKEQIDTSTPLGRAMMYICSVFAQMERETIAERVKDNMLELAKSGKWAGGKAPLGFSRKRVEINGKNHTILIKNPEEIPFLNLIADTFLQGYSLNGLEKYFRKISVKTINGYYLSSTQIYNILRNPHYCTADSAAYDYFKNLGCIISSDRDSFDGRHGIIAYGRTSYQGMDKHCVNPPEKWNISVGLHEPLFDSDKWIRIQNRFGQNVFNRTRKHHIGILKGVVKCKCGCSMLVKRKIDKTYHITYDSYSCALRSRKGVEYCDMSSVSVSKMDDAILNILRQIKLDKSMIDNYTADTSAVSNVRSKKLIQQDIKAANRKIENLTISLSENSSSAAAKYLIGELEKLDKQINSLNFELRESEICEQKKVSSFKGRDEKYDSVCSVLDSIENANYEEINIALKSLLTECVYDGEKLKIKL